jgi:hypothetical protein
MKSLLPVLFMFLVSVANAQEPPEQSQWLQGVETGTSTISMVAAQLEATMQVLDVAEELREEFPFPFTVTMYQDRVETHQNNGVYAYTIYWHAVITGPF